MSRKRKIPIDAFSETLQHIDEKFSTIAKRCKRDKELADIAHIAKKGAALTQGIFLDIKNFDAPISQRTRSARKRTKAESSASSESEESVATTQRDIVSQKQDAAPESSSSADSMYDSEDLDSAIPKPLYAPGDWVKVEGSDAVHRIVHLYYTRGAFSYYEAKKFQGDACEIALLHPNLIAGLAGPPPPPPRPIEDLLSLESSESASSVHPEAPHASSEKSSEENAEPVAVPLDTLEPLDTNAEHCACEPNSPPYFWTSDVLEQLGEYMTDNGQESAEFRGYLGKRIAEKDACSIARAAFEFLDQRSVRDFNYSLEGCAFRFSPCTFCKRSGEMCFETRKTEHFDACLMCLDCYAALPHFEQLCLYLDKIKDSCSEAPSKEKLESVAFRIICIIQTLRQSLKRIVDPRHEQPRNTDNHLE